MYDNKKEDYTKKIPPIPPILAKVFGIVKMQSASIKALCAAISEDEAFKELFFKVVNSKYFTLGQEIKSVQKATVLLGAMRIKNIIVAISLRKLYYSMGFVHLWKHSIKCALAAKNLAEENKIMNPDDAFITGFLHDIGKIILYKNEKDNYVSSEVDFSRSDRDIIEYENSVFETNHCILGAMILRKWEMPNLLIDCVKYHHSPTLSSAPMACGLIYAADRLVLDKQTDQILEKNLIERLGIIIEDTKARRLMALTKSEIFMEGFEIK